MTGPRPTVRGRDLSLWREPGYRQMGVPTLRSYRPYVLPVLTCYRHSGPTDLRSVSIFIACRRTGETPNLVNRENLVNPASERWRDAGQARARRLSVGQFRQPSQMPIRIFQCLIDDTTFNVGRHREAQQIAKRRRDIDNADLPLQSNPFPNASTR